MKLLDTTCSDFRQTFNGQYVHFLYTRKKKQIFLQSPVMLNHDIIITINTVIMYIFLLLSF